MLSKWAVAKSYIQFPTDQLSEQGRKLLEIGELPVDIVNFIIDKVLKKLAKFLGVKIIGPRDKVDVTIDIHTIDFAPIYLKMWGKIFFLKFTIFVKVC